MADPRGGVKRRTAAERAEMRAECYKLYAQHKNFYEIGEALSMSHEMARQYVYAAIKETNLPDREEDIKRTLDLLEQNLIIANDKYKETKSNRDYMVIDKILHMRARLIGSYAPDRVEATVTQKTQLDESISNLLSQMEQADAQRPIEATPE